MDRRDFLRKTSLAGGLAAACSTFIQAKPQSAAIVLDPSDPLTTAHPVQWAVAVLERALKQAGWGVARRDKPEAGELTIVAAGPKSSFAINTLPAASEGCALLETNLNGIKCLLALGRDSRGLTYALSEIADRVRNNAALEVKQPIIETPANKTRSVMRQFTSELLDKPWFYDRDGWTQYLDLLASQRWNRLDLAFGLGYDSLNRVNDSYFLFFYPFVVAVPAMTFG